MQSQSPPLHHPVPQHPIHPAYQANAYGVPPVSAAVPEAPAGFPVDQQFGIDMGRHAFQYGQRYLGENMERYASNLPVFRHYFQVSNSYVVRKIALILFPWRHRRWTRDLLRSDATGAVESYALPRDDINSPDMYIPVMAFTTFLVVSGFAQGLSGVFHPEQLGLVASKSLAVIICEIIFLKVFLYLLGAGSSSLLDFIAYSGYKFIGITLDTFANEMPSKLVKWSVFLYTSAATSFFLLRSLRYVVLPEISISTATLNSSQRQHRIQFLFVYSFVVQFFLMWLLQT